MDLQALLADRIDSLPDGDYMPGIRAVLAHLRAAITHFRRGSEDGDDTAFTDAIYRSNQVFEGSLKEAYRVLTSSDPAHSTPAQIENHLINNSILRSRVISQLTNYRQHWRNPSTHDYRLDFDEDEALLAVTSVAVFAIVLVDQIAERLYRDEFAESTPAVEHSGRPLVERVEEAIAAFTSDLNHRDSLRFNIRENELAAALAAALSAALPSVTVATDWRLDKDRSERADLALIEGSDKCLLEIKRTKPSAINIQQGVEQLIHYMALSGVKQAVLYFYYSHNTGRTNIQVHDLPGIGGTVLVLATEPLPGA